MAAFPQLSVRVAFATNPYDYPPTFTEIGPASGAGPGNAGWVRKITTKRGRERLLASQAQFQAGTMSAELDNRDRRFDPTNTSGPYWPNVQPEKLIQVGATYPAIGGTFYPIWTGYIDDWPQMWPGFSESNVPLTATDYFKAAALQRLMSAGYQQQVIADSPAGYWRLGDPVGSTVALDSSGNGLNGVPNAGVTFGETGAMPANVGTSAELAGSSGSSGAGSVDLPTGILTNGNDVSIECWVKTTHTSSDNLYVVSVAPSSTLSGFFLWIEPGGAPLLYCDASIVTGPTPINDGNWHHVVGTVDIGGGPGSMELYVDGQLANSATYTPGVGLGGAQTYIGAQPSGVGQSADSCDAQEVALYNYTLSPLQISNHFELGAWPSEYTGQVINRILDVNGFPSGQRNVDTGYTLCQEDTQDETQTKVLDQMQKLEQTEQGQCFVAANGDVTFQDRYHRYAYPNASSTATLGDGGSAYPTELPYAMGGVVLNFDRMELFNDIPVTRRNGNLQEAFDQASITEFTDRVLVGLSDLLMEYDLDAMGCAEWILSDTAYPQYRVGQLILDPLANPALWPIVLGSEIGTVLTVNKHNIPGGGSPLPISIACRIEGIEHQIDAPHSWKCTMHVSLAGTQPWLILNDPVMDVLDAGNRYGW